MTEFLNDRERVIPVGDESISTLAFSKWELLKHADRTNTLHVLLSALPLVK